MFDQEQLWNKALDYFPGGTQTTSKFPNQFADGIYPKFVDSANGAHIIDINGKKYLDFMCSLGPIILGYNNKEVNNAIKNQLKKGTIFSFPTLLEQELAELIRETVPSAEQMRFAKNGSDSNTASVRIARAYTGKEKILKVKGGYHGWGDWHAITIWENGIPLILKNIIDEFQYNDLESLELLLKKGDVAGVIMEPQALETPKAGFLEGVRELCNKYKALLIFDEVVSGFRWSLGGAQKYYGVTPDITCLGKAITNGLPLSVVCGKREYMQSLDDVFFSMTFGGDCLSMAAAIENIKQLKQKDYGHIWKLGGMLEDGFRHLIKKHDLDAKFLGSAPRHLLSFSKETYTDMHGVKTLFFQEMLKKEILFPNVIYIQFSHTEKDIEKTIKAADKSFKFVKENLYNIDKVLEAKRSKTIFTKNT